jgi:molybdenum cofactor biosynthesis enzyme MoaA
MTLRYFCETCSETCLSNNNRNKICIFFYDTQVLLRDLLGDVSFEREAAVLR